MIDPRRVLTFREVARLGSFSRAAEALSLTQPAVSQQVAALERQAGARLLERGPGGLSLTPAGDLLAHADVVADRLELASGQLAEQVAHAARELRIGAFPSALATRVPRALGRLTAERPEVKADVTEGTTDELIERVRSGALHVAVCFQDAAVARREHEGTERADLDEEPFAALLPHGHPLAGTGPIGLADLAEETWVAPSRDGLIVRACEAAGFTPSIRYVSRDPLANRGLVAAGLAVTISPAGLAAESPDRGRARARRTAPLRLRAVAGERRRPARARLRRCVGQRLRTGRFQPRRPMSRSEIRPRRSAVPCSGSTAAASVFVAASSERIESTASASEGRSSSIRSSAASRPAARSSARSIASRISPPRRSTSPSCAVSRASIPGSSRPAIAIACRSSSARSTRRGPISRAGPRCGPV